MTRLWVFLNIFALLAGFFLWLYWRERNERRRIAAELARARAALDTINQVDALSFEDHVEHIIRDHGPEDTKAHYRLLAKQMQEVEVACYAFYQPILEEMEARAEKRMKEKGDSR